MAQSSTDIAASEIQSFDCSWTILADLHYQLRSMAGKWPTTSTSRHTNKIASVADLVSATEGRRQIVKFHGDFDDEASSYLMNQLLQRLNYDSPLDIKLSNDVLGNSVLFIGYSISDINIRLLFYRLTEMWGLSVLPSARPKSYVFMNRPNPVAREVLGQWGIEMIVSEEDDPKKALTDFLQELVS
ncbi:SIR2 family protein [Pseudomonas aeruginosa]|uniref:SIR2 family protein n=1 Tax=Pseudomonas aeruginosa TaxID=287 RepID=UPI00287FC664|nr:SIR2 family protein [Pseudomonas aeruginosa]